MRIGLLDFDGKAPNIALQKLSAYYKAHGSQVILNNFLPSQVDKVFCSVLFTWNRRKAEFLRDLYKDIEFGGSGYDLKKTLPVEIEAMAPDYSLYTPEHLLPRLKGIKSADKKLAKARELVASGIGHLYRGCTNGCSWCLVPKKEGRLRRVSRLESLINPASNRLLLLDNNFTAQPDCIDTCREIRDRKLAVSLTQGIDIRLVDDDKALALSQVRHIGRKIHFAWDKPGDEAAIMKGIEVLSRYIPHWKMMCYMLVGFDTTWEEDFYRFRKLSELKIDPYVMVYNRDEGRAAARIRHFARWVNSRICKVTSFADYEPWVRARSAENLSLLAA